MNTEHEPRARRGGAQRKWVTALSVRALHAYAGALFAPAILFFAVTGALQVFDLHKPRAQYQPSSALVMLGSLHKDQVLKAPHASDRPHHAHRHADVGDPDGQAPQVGLRQLLLKWYAAAGAIGLALATLVGLYMSLQYRRDRLVMLLLLAAGLAVPIALLFA